MLVELPLLPPGNSAARMFAALCDSVFVGPPIPPVTLYETAEKKLGIKRSEPTSAITQAMMINRRRLRIKKLKESKRDDVISSRRQRSVFSVVKNSPDRQS